MDIKTQPGYKDSTMVDIYVSLFGEVILEALPKFITLLNKIIKGHNMYTVPVKYSIARNLVIRKALQFSEKKTR